MCLKIDMYIIFFLICSDHIKHLKPSRLIICNLLYSSKAALETFNLKNQNLKYAIYPVR